jgi:anthranilate synthase/aminodeoxychorismate synthase-like glutamine amidotransferase
MREAAIISSLITSMNIIKRGAEMILIIDNYDSFTYNIAHGFGVMNQEILVFRSDAITIDRIKGLAPSAIVISPGPGGPEDAGISCKVIEKLGARIPILGVCLGHQCIAQVFGARIVRAHNLVHGKRSEIFHDNGTIFNGVRNPFKATRYHSLIAAEESIPESLDVSAYTMEGEVMGIRGKESIIEGVQFHPESIATPQGMMILRNFLDLALGLASAA